jgi:FKBP-type peptidyl-prolyl cis-trans isomerase
VIIEKGNDSHPVASSTITVNYKGYYLDGDVFDEGQFFTAPLSNLIEGWKEGIPLIGEGGKMKLIIPSHLAYNDRVRAFDITLHYFSK